jgi:hypothetical protein
MKFGMKNPYVTEKPVASPALFKQKALALRSYKSQCDFYTQKIRYTVAELEELWTNDIQTSFIEELDAMKPRTDDYLQLVDEYASLLELAAQELENRTIDIDKASVLDDGSSGPIPITLSDISYLRRSRIDLGAHDPYYAGTQVGVSDVTVGSRKNTEYMYTVYSDHVELVKYIGMRRTIEIPSELDGVPVTHIGQDCFAMAWRIKPVSITIPDTVTTLLPGAFRGCQYIRELKLPDSIRYIGNYACSFLTSLESITIPEGVISLGMGAFRNCTELLAVEIPNATLRIGNDCFYRCTNLRSVKIGDSVVDIDGWAFRQCEHLAEVDMNDNAKKLGASVFYDDIMLTKVEVPQTVKEIGDAAFYSRRGITVVCEEGTVAEQYARENKIKYEIKDAV